MSKGMDSKKNEKKKPAKTMKEKKAAKEERSGPANNTSPLLIGRTARALLSCIARRASLRGQRTAAGPSLQSGQTMIAKTASGWVVAVAWLLGSASALQAQEAVPGALRPPTGYTVAFTAQASGVQIYTSTREPGSPLKWTLEAPLAELRAPAGVIHHYAGPSWEAADGSRIVRDKDVPVVTVPASQPTTDIPWLLIKVAPEATPGILSKVAYVQRTATAGGVAPSTAPVNAGTKVGVPYTATYVFYVKSP